MGIPGGRRGTLRHDYFLIALTLLLTLLGMVTLFSASYLFALNQPRRFPGGFSPLFGNSVVCVGMVFLFPILVLIPFGWLKKGWLIVAVVVVTLVLNILPLLEPFRGSGSARRWIFLNEGLSFQPSELIKIVLPLYLAYILDKNNDRLNSFVYGPLPPVIVTALFCSLVLVQSNLSDAILVAVASMTVCIVAGIPFGWFILVFAAAAPVFYKLVFGDKEGRWYRRLADFYSGEPSPPELMTQIDYSLEAIKAGGFWGKGIGQGTLKIRMPEVHGDFIFASFVEESGFIGVVVYLVLIGVFVGISYLVAWRSSDRFAQILAFGLVTPIALQTLVNIAVVVRFIPTTGIPLPFVSSGGSSLLVTLISAALLVNIARLHVKSEKRGAPYAG